MITKFLLSRFPVTINGLNDPRERSDTMREAPIWNQVHRDELAIQISRAEEMREQELGYHLSKRYIANEEYPYNEQGLYILLKKHLVSVGRKTTVDISIGEPLVLSYLTTIYDPVVISIATTLTSTDGIIVSQSRSEEQIGFISLALGMFIVRYPPDM